MAVFVHLEEALFDAKGEEVRVFSHHDVSLPSPIHEG